MTEVTTLEVYGNRFDASSIKGDRSIIARIMAMRPLTIAYPITRKSITQQFALNSPIPSLLYSRPVSSLLDPVHCLPEIFHVLSM
jgi:hypothetical protein